MTGTDMQTVGDMLHRRHYGLTIAWIGCRLGPDDVSEARGFKFGEPEQGLDMRSIHNVL